MITDTRLIGRLSKGLIKTFLSSPVFLKHWLIRLPPAQHCTHGCLDRNSSFVAHYQHPIQPSTKHWWLDGSIKKKTQLGFPLPCQSCGGKTTNQFNTFSQVPQRQKTKNKKTHIYTDCTLFRWCIENKNKLVKQTEIVAKCFAIIWWLQQQQTNKQWEHYKNPPLPSPQPILFFHTVLSQWRQSSIICPHTLDWRQLLRHFCRLDSHPEKQQEEKNNKSEYNICELNLPSDRVSKSQHLVWCHNNKMSVLVSSTSQRVWSNMLNELGFSSEWYDTWF